MNDDVYLELLENAWKKIPEGFHETERWQIPKATIITEGKYTIITNFSEIIDSIKRDGKEFLTYLLNDLATSGEIKGQRAFIKGSQKISVLNREIEVYCRKYVICPTCNKPDTNIIREGRSVILNCTACGSNTNLRA
jgi:translation initiation factor 2 subunit 2